MSIIESFDQSFLPNYDPGGHVSRIMARMAGAVSASMHGQVERWLEGLIADGRVYKQPVHAVYPQRNFGNADAITFSELHAMIPRNAHKNRLKESEVGKHYPTYRAEVVVKLR